MARYRSRNRPYEIAEHDPSWRERFEEEAGRIKEIFGDDAIRIEHVGSTSVPGLAAKPTIDILVIVGSAAAADKYNEPMAALGYRALGAFIADDTRLFEKEIEGERRFIVHVFEGAHPHTGDMIKVRDYLTSHPEEARAYGQLKQSLKLKYPDDYVSYRKEKDAYMTELTRRALSGE